MGTPELFGTTSTAPDDDAVRMARMFRSALTPRAAAALYRYILENVDVRAALPLVQARTLVLHSVGNPIVGREHARYLADHIPDARVAELPGVGLTAMDTTASALAIDTIAEFLTGGTAAVDVDRVLATILFTDIVGSTEQIESEGDARWRARLDEHDRLVRALLRHHRGHEVNTTGDGFVASFDGPARAIRCAVAIVEAARGLGLTIRAGLHTGECELRGGAPAGFAVHVAARVCGATNGGDVVVTATVRDLVMGSGIVFDDLGEHPLKGVSDPWRLYRVVDA